MLIALVNVALKMKEKYFTEARAMCDNQRFKNYNFIIYQDSLFEELSHFSRNLSCLLFCIAIFAANGASMSCSCTNFRLLARQASG
jgi:hypothetical protein